jgi:cytochrome c oxidase subunit 3
MAYTQALRGHYSDISQQREAAKLGMWIFLLTEILLFGGLFCAYSIYRAWYPDIFYNAHKAMDVQMGTLNTAVLITSSLTMALAIRSLQIDRVKTAIAMLATTFALGAAFLFIHYLEYRHHFELGQLPGKYYTYTGIKGTNPHLFFTFYFSMTGLHSLHVIAGMTAISWMTYRTVKRHFSSKYFTPVEITGLYWHLVDMVWIFLFPLLYLVG